MKAWLLVAIVGMAAVFTSAWLWLNDRPYVEPEFGVTFSTAYARELGFEPEAMYGSLLDDLGVGRVRLPVYWSEVDPLRSDYQWEELDRLVAMSQERDALLTIVVGMKVPRWPECHIPAWAQALAPEDRHKATLAFIQAVVERYRDSSAVIRWQVENEPFFPYGVCPTISPAQFQERVDLVRRLDDRPIQVTVSGEIGPWLEAAKTADVLGFSLYRETWNDVFGYFVYPLTPEFYFVRAAMVADDVERVVVSELQAEPWFPQAWDSRPMREWYDAFTADMLLRNVEFAREARVSEAYLWGAEWWYAMREAGDDRLWEAAKQVFDEL